MKSQLLKMGLSLDWTKEVATCHQTITNMNKSFYRYV